MKQLSMGTGFEKYSKTTRREQFLGEMERIVPWTELCALIVPYYPKVGDGRPPKALEMMLRIYFLQQWFGNLGTVYLYNMNNRSGLNIRMLNID